MLKIMNFKYISSRQSGGFRDNILNLYLTITEQKKIWSTLQILILCQTTYVSVEETRIGKVLIRKTNAKPYGNC
jgi:hypothetical protein